MSDHAALRQEIRYALDGARARIRTYTGLYANEDLTREVLLACDAASARTANPRMKQAKRLVESRCRQLAEAADRFGERDLTAIATSRAQALAALDLFQDAAFEARKAEGRDRPMGSLLKRRSV